MKLSKTTFFLGCLVGGMGAAALPLLFSVSPAQSKLLPFQGRLTNSDGTPITPDQAKVVEFKLYDAPAGGTVKWAGEVHKLSVNGGLVNTMLGSKASLGSVDFSTPTYLQITVDADGDNLITAADPPLLPRQSVVPAVYAVVAGELQYGTGSNYASVKGSEIFEANGKLKAAAIAETNGISANQLAPNSVATSEIADSSVTAAKMAPGAVDGLIGANSITSPRILDGEVKTADLGADAVTSDKVQNGSVLGEDLAAGLLRPTHFAQDAIPASLLERDAVVISEIKDAGVGGGMPTGPWTTRPLNTVEFATKTSGSAIAFDAGTKKISLAPGTYKITASAKGFRVAYHQLAVRDVTVAAAPVIKIRGLSTLCSYSNPPGAEASATSILEGYLVVTTTGSQYDLAHYMDSYSSVWGGNQTMGVSVFTPAQTAEKNVYSRITIERVK